jgi:chlorophyll(ide) b reductase
MCVHSLRPCVLPGSDLLLDGATNANKAVFNILCEQPEMVAAFLVPRVRTIAARGEVARYVRFLTAPRALARFITAPFRLNRFFNPKGGLRVALRVQ